MPLFFYNIITFYTLPFLLLLLMQGSFGNAKTTTGVEIAFHVINFLVAIAIFWQYLKESFQDFSYDVLRVLKISGIYALLGIAAAAVLFCLGTFVLISASDLYAVIALSALPMTELDMFTAPMGLVETTPVLSGICLLALSPLTISCLFYAAVFSPIANSRPWLAYLLIIPYVAFPYLCNGLTAYWDLTPMVLIFLTRLPIHLLACRAYHKTDSVWAPIITLTICNLAGFVFLLVQELYTYHF